MARRFLVSGGVVSNPRPWQDPPPPNTRVVDEAQFRELFPRLSDERVAQYAAPDTPPKRRPGRPRKEPTPGDLFVTSSD